MAKSKDFESEPPQDYQSLDFLDQGIRMAKDLRSIADFILAGMKHLKNHVYLDYLHEAALVRVMALTENYDKKAAEEKLREAVSNLSKEKYGTDI